MVEPVSVSPRRQSGVMQACGTVGFDTAGGHTCTREPGHDGHHQEGGHQFDEWGDFHRVNLGAEYRKDLVQCHHCWLVIKEEHCTAHMRVHQRRWADGRG